MFVGTIIKDTWTITGLGGEVVEMGGRWRGLGVGLGPEGRKLYLNNNKINNNNKKKLFGGVLCCSF